MIGAGAAYEYISGSDSASSQEGTGLNSVWDDGMGGS
jgi:hypothetical protein